MADKEGFLLCFTVCLQGCDDGRVVGAESGAYLARAANEVVAVEEVIDGDSQERVSAAPGDGVATATRGIMESFFERCEIGGVGAAIEVSKDDERSLSGGGVLMNAGESGVSELSFLGAQGCQGVGIDDGDDGVVPSDLRG